MQRINQESCKKHSVDNRQKQSAFVAGNDATMEVLLVLVGMAGDCVQVGSQSIR